MVLYLQSMTDNIREIWNTGGTGLPRSAADMQPPWILEKGPLCRWCLQQK